MLLFLLLIKGLKVNAVNLNALSCYRAEISSPVNESAISKKIVILMESRLVAKNELNHFLRDNSQELAAFAIKTPVNWTVFSKCMKKHMKKRSKLSKLLKKLDRFVSTEGVYFSQKYPHGVRSNIARVLPGDLNNNAESLVKMKQLLIGDFHYLKASPKIQDIPISDLSRWINYQKIPLSTLNLTEKDLDSLLPGLEYVDLSNFPVKDIPYLLSRLIKVSHLSCNRLTDSELKFLTELKYLKSLDISESDMTDMGMDAVAKLLKLTSLNISGIPQISNAFIQLISSFNALTSLDLSGCVNVSYQGLQYLVKCKNLKKLDVSCCDIEDVELKILGTFASLEVLNLSCCKGIKSKSLVHIGKLTHLTDLKLSFLGIEDIGLMNIIYLKNLRSLTLEGCRKISDIGINSLSFIPHLSFLSLKGCSRITDQTIECLQPLYQTLNKLDLSGCYEIKDEGVRRIGGLTELTDLSLKGCNQVSDKGLYYLLGLLKLKYLNLQHCSGTKLLGRTILKTAIEFVKD